MGIRAKVLGRVGAGTHRWDRRKHCRCTHGALLPAETERRGELSAEGAVGTGEQPPSHASGSKSGPCKVMLMSQVHGIRYQAAYLPGPGGETESHSPSPGSSQTNAPIAPKFIILAAHSDLALPVSRANCGAWLLLHPVGPNCHLLPHCTLLSSALSSPADGRQCRMSVCQITDPANHPCTRSSPAGRGGRRVFCRFIEPHIGHLLLQKSVFPVHASVICIDLSGLLMLQCHLLCPARPAQVVPADAAEKAGCPAA